MSCGEHGVVVAAVPWARHGARHTRAFDETVAWLATRCSKSAVCELTQIAGARSVPSSTGSGRKPVRPSIVSMVCAESGSTGSYKKGHKYLTVVVDHDSGRLVWAAQGRNAATLRRFFDALGQARCAAITHVTAVESRVTHITGTTS